MVAIADLVPFAVLGLVGSLHCAGMCGPLVLSFEWTRATRGRAWGSTIAYVVGKSMTYALLALLLAQGAVALGRAQPEGLALSRSIFAWVAGLAMVLVGLTTMGVRLWPVSSRFRPLAGVAAGLHRSASGLPKSAQGFAFGFANGFLPCGLSWSVIALAAASSLDVVVLGPLVFGLATGPVLAAIALGGRAVPLAWRARGRHVAALALVAVGLWTVWRGGLPSLDGTPSVPPCCDEGPPLERVSGDSPAPLEHPADATQRE